MSQPNLYGGETTCGYCHRLLEPVAGTPNWECPACAPELRQIKDEDEWATWMRAKVMRRIRFTVDRD